MSEGDLYDVVIVGGGPGGLSAGVYAMRAGLKTILIEKGVAGGQVAVSDSVENYLGFPGLDFHSVRLANGDLLETRTLILATGGSPRKLQVPGEEEYYGKGVSYCGVCDGFFFKDKTVVVVGGGDTAAEEALYLAKLAKQVYLVHRRDALRASMILQQRVKEECKIEVLWNTIVTEIKANDEGVIAVTLQDTQTEEQRELAIDGVFIFIGFIPNNQLVPAGTKMNADGYVVTNEKCETNMPGIYVVGDLREKYAKQIVVAAADGCTAALVAAYYVEMKKSGSEEVCELPEELFSSAQ
jgi:thioredoxin reductase (NADPH)